MQAVEPIVLYCVDKKGERYVFGSEQSPLASDPKGPWDCSELTQVSHNHFGVALPDGAYNQWKFCHPLSVAQALRTRGALLFAGTGHGSGRDAIHHVAMSLGDGTTIEARGHVYGVGTWPAAGRFAFAGLVPGVAYAVNAGPNPLAKPNQGGGVQLGAGATGEAVVFFQNMANILEAYIKVGDRKPLAVDGKFGGRTIARTKEIQAWCNAMFALAHNSHRIPVSGLADRDTCSVMGSWINHFTS